MRCDKCGKITELKQYLLPFVESKQYEVTNRGTVLYSYNRLEMNNHTVDLCDKCLENLGARQKSKTKGKWAFLKFPTDMAIYAVCQNCGFTYPSYNQPRNESGSWNFKVEPSLEKLYRYCPNCGLKMKPFNGDFVYKYSDLVNEDE